MERFRARVHELGGVCLVHAIFAGALFVLRANVGLLFDWMLEPWGAALVAGYAVFCLALGALTFLKKRWALMLGLGLGYSWLIWSVLAWLTHVSAHGGLSIGALFPAMMSGAVVLRCQQVIGWAKQMQAEGIPLDARPTDFPRIERSADSV
ncbi:hypothetical protein D7V80_22915 [Corallococcus sp. CA054B]|nr:hypothetical protein D7V80_22915 [Corallococcus sp. CA054B]